jgi:hypothetical protein
MTLDGAMVFFDTVVLILRLAYFNLSLLLPVEALQRALVRT